MKYDFDTVIGFGGFVIGLVGIGYAISSRKQLNTVCAKIDKSVEEMSTDIRVDISESLVKQSVDKAIEREVERTIKHTTEDVVRDVRNTIRTKVDAAVDAQYNDIKGSVTKQIADEVSKINVSRLTDEVRAQAKQAIVDKFDGNLDDILDKFNYNLDNINKIYGSISRTMSHDNGKEMTFKIS